MPSHCASLLAQLKDLRSQAYDVLQDIIGKNSVPSDEVFTSVVHMNSQVFKLSQSLIDSLTSFKNLKPQYLQQIKSQNINLHEKLTKEISDAHEAAKHMGMKQEELNSLAAHKLFFKLEYLLSVANEALALAYNDDETAKVEKQVVEIADKFYTPEEVLLDTTSSLTDKQAAIIDVINNIKATASIKLYLMKTVALGVDTVTQNEYEDVIEGLLALAHSITNGNLSDRLTNLAATIMKNNELIRTQNSIVTDPSSTFYAKSQAAKSLVSILNDSQNLKDDLVKGIAEIFQVTFFYEKTCMHSLAYWYIFICVFSLSTFII